MLIKNVGCGDDDSRGRTERGQTAFNDRSSTHVVYGYDKSNRLDSLAPVHTVALDGAGLRFLFLFLFTFMFSFVLTFWASILCVYSLGISVLF